MRDFLFLAGVALIIFAFFTGFGGCVRLCEKPAAPSCSCQPANPKP